MAGIAETFDLAWRCHQAGDFYQAEHYYQQVLQDAPDHADCRHMLGILAYQTGRYDLAVASIRSALLLNPTAAYHCNLGLALQALGQLHEAVASYNEALRVDGGFAPAHNNLGNALLSLGDRAGAIAHYRQALTRAPDYAEAHCNLGLALISQQELEEAAKHFSQALALNPNYADAHNNLAHVLTSQNKFQDAVDHCREAIRLKPDFPEAHNNLGNALNKLGKTAEALRQWEQALVMRPNFPEAHNNLGNALSSRGKMAEAEAQFREALRLNPFYAEAHNNLGNILRDLKKPEEAFVSFWAALRINPKYSEAFNNLGTLLAAGHKTRKAVSCYRRALKLKPDSGEVYNNLANALPRLHQLDEAAFCFEQALRLDFDFVPTANGLGLLRLKQGRFDTALDLFEQALAKDPGYAMAHLNRALLWLAHGRWDKGWKEYEWRWNMKDSKVFSFQQPRWDGAPLAGRTLLVIAEQGLGDTLHFLRYIPPLQLDGKIILQCQPALVRLVKDCSKVEHVVAEGDALPEFDLYAPLLSLPAILGTTPSNVPADVPYLWPAPRLVEHWQNELSALNGFKIGVAWQGNPTYAGDAQRSIPLKLFKSLADIEGVNLISLQRGAGVEQLQKLAGAFPILDLGERLDVEAGAFMDTAALMKSLDLVISSDTALPHLAGALGLPVWVALPLVPDWRWMLQRDDSPWYPTMRLFRQSSYGQWHEVFKRMAEELKPTLATWQNKKSESRA